MKRPILVITLGYIIGIIWGLYFKFSIVLLYISLAIILLMRNIKIKYYPKKRVFKLFSIHRYFRYVKLLFSKKMILILVLSSIISNSIIIYKNYQYENLYKNIQNAQILGIVNSSKQEKDYKNVYKIRVLTVNNTNKFSDTYLYINVDKKINLDYADKILIKGTYKSPQESRNYGGFNYKNYLKTLNIYGSVDVTNIDVLEKSSNFFSKINNLKESIKLNAKKIFSENAYSLFLGLILADNSVISDNVENDFRNSGISHVLSVSGMHISYIIIGISKFFNKLVGKKYGKVLTIGVLIFYIFITGFIPSLFRASFMGIMILVSSLLHRKNDLWNTIFFSLLVILLYNPYLITNIGLQLSYLGTVGIILFSKNILKFLNKEQENKSKIKETIAVSISAQIAILPFTFFHFNTFGIYFLIANLLINFIIGPTIIVGFILFIFMIFGMSIAGIISPIFNFLIELVLLISKIGTLPLAKLYIRTPTVLEIIVFYIIVFLINLIYIVKTKKILSASLLRVKWIYDLLKYKLRTNMKKTIAVVLISSLVFRLMFFVIPQKLQLHFLDVGQGDSCFIVTPNNKTILIDGGGSEFGSFDVGENTLLPYILDRGYTCIDYILISHFDSDHVGGILTILEELYVKNVIISKQKEESDNYKKFLEIVKTKKIKVTIVQAGNKVKVDKDVYLNILWPTSELEISDNALNNNSIVAKFVYKNFSVLFTGDIEEIAEEAILKKYKNSLNNLNATVLKIAHHGSKTSSTESFLNAVKPKFALIGVGQNNKFGHPSDITLQNLGNINCKIYRTDEDGEITINTNGESLNFITYIE